MAFAEGADAFEGTGASVKDLHGRAATYPAGGVTMGGYCTKMVVPAMHRRMCKQHP